MPFERKFLLAVIGIKIMLVLAALFLFGEERLIWADTMHYATLGTNMLAHKGFGFGAPTTEFMPLYPFLLGFFKLHVPYGFVILSLLQAVAAGATALVVFYLARMYLSQKWSFLVAGIAMFEPLVSAIHILLIPETFFILFVLIFLYSIVKFLRKDSMLYIYSAAAALAFALYTKPAASYLIFITLPFFIIPKLRLRAFFIFCSILIIAVSPWLWRNYQLAGFYVLNTNASRNICGWGLTGVLAVKYGADSSNWATTNSLPEFKQTSMRCTSSLGALRIFLTEYPKEFITMMALSSASILTNDGFTALFEKPAEEQVKIHHNYLTPAVFANADWKAKVISALNEFSFSERALIFAAKLFWLIVAVFAVIGIAYSLLRKKNRTELAFLFLTGSYFLFASALAAGLAAGTRYRYQIAALLLIFAAMGLNVLWKRIERRIPITRVKIHIAYILYRLARLFVRSDKRVVARGGVTYEADLTEGIDLSIFLFGNFQKHVYQNRFIKFRGDEIIFDVGANTGFMALQFAKRAPRGSVHAFEPTHFAYKKMKHNISLNPELANRIVLRNLFVSSRDELRPDITAYASWKVDGMRRAEDHPIHWGSAKGAEGVPSITLDTYIKKATFQRLDVIKIDTDGHEWDVLLGGRETIRRFRPVVIFEVADYVMRERGISFTNYLVYFKEYGYRLYNSKSGEEITEENYTEHIPLRGSIDVIATRA